MPILNDRNSFQTNVLITNLYLEKTRSILDTGMSVVVKNLTGQSLSADSDIRKETNRCIANSIKKINAYKSFLQLLSEIPADLNDIASYYIRYITKSASQYILKKTQIISLQIKKVVASVKKKIAELTKEILQFCTSGTGNPAISALLSPVILLFRGISILANAILIGINAVLSVLPPIVAVNAEGMSFFMTPKSLNTTAMNVLNMNNSVVYKIPSEIQDKINQVLMTVNKLNIPIKMSAVTAGAALGAAAVRENGNFNIGCKDLSKLNPRELLRVIETIISVIPLAEPLPKFENLSITNLGFLIWLMTGFCPAGRSSFGMPGQP